MSLKTIIKNIILDVMKVFFIIIFINALFVHDFHFIIILPRLINLSPLWYLWIFQWRNPWLHACCSVWYTLSLACARVQKSLSISISHYHRLNAICAHDELIPNLKNNSKKILEFFCVTNVDEKLQKALVLLKITKAQLWITNIRMFWNESKICMSFSLFLYLPLLAVLNLRQLW